MRDIATRVPVNRTAAKVIAKSKDNYVPEYTVSPHVLHTLERPKIAPFLGIRAHDLSGKRFGHLRVLGPYLCKTKTKGGANRQGNTRWVVQCDCGYYEARTTKALKKNNPEGNKCLRCQKIDYFAQRQEKSNL